jgi:hypothetical protein
VCGRIVLSQVGFDFHDSGRQVWPLAHQHFAQEFAGYALRSAREEGSVEGMDWG